MTMQEKVSSGYKQSEVGVIPEDWSCSRISELIDGGAIIGHLDGNHGALYPRSHEFVSYGVRYVTANDFESGVVDLSKCRCLKAERAAQFKKGVSVSGDVLFAHNATVGPVALLITSEPYVILSTTATYFRCSPGKLSNQFLRFALQAPYFVSQYSAIMSQSTRNQVPITAQRKLFLSLPPIGEQTAIAEALSDADARIAALEALIAKKRDLKQAAMQQLLTGKTRLPGFSGEWEVKPLGDLISAIGDGGTPATSNLQNFGGGVHWVVIDDIKPEIWTTKNSLSEAGLARCSAKLWPAGTLILSTGATIGEVGVARIPVATKQGICGIVFDPRSAHVQFMKYWFSLNRPLLLSKAQGSTIFEVRPPTLVKIEGLFPEVVEQTAIAEILSDMDAELASLDAEAEKARTIKQGMMQNLLTGKVRLV